jgi:Rrf2 family protein
MPISRFVSEIVDNPSVRISAKADYAVRAAVELASVEGPVKGDSIAQAQEIPLKFLENILIEMRHAGLVRSQRGREGGYWLARPPDEITIADVVRAVEGPLAHVRGEPPETVHYPGPAEALEQVWIAVRANLRAVVERVTVADVASGSLPDEIVELADDPDAWITR